MVFKKIDRYRREISAHRPELLIKRLDEMYKELRSKTLLHTEEYNHIRLTINVGFSTFDHNIDTRHQEILDIMGEEWMSINEIQEKIDMKNRMLRHYVYEMKKTGIIKNRRTFGNRCEYKVIKND